jgi:hypothetical protein
MNALRVVVRIWHSGFGEWRFEESDAERTEVIRSQRQAPGAQLPAGTWSTTN